MAWRRLLLLLGQFPFDPTSGAAQSMRQTAELLAARGWAVRCLATDACEGSVTGDTLSMLAGAGHSPTIADGTVLPDARSMLLESGGVAHELVRVLEARKRHWPQDVGAEYDARFERLVRAFRPHVVLTFGDDPGDVLRRELARAAGARVVFALHNLAYLPRRPAACDAYLAPSAFLARRYAEQWRIDIATLPTVVMTDRVVATTRDPAFVTVVNPEPAKGLWLVARIAERLGVERPDIPVLVVEGRASAGTLIAAGRAGGVALDSFENLMMARATPDVSQVWCGTRVVLVPSVVEEAAGRVAIEAMLNGAVPIASDRGALPETLDRAGRVVPLPGDYTLATHGPIDPAVAEPWVRAIVELMDDEQRFEQASRLARETAARHLPERVGDAYESWFDSLAT